MQNIQTNKRKRSAEREENIKSKQWGHENLTLTYFFQKTGQNDPRSFINKTAEFMMCQKKKYNSWFLTCYTFTRTLILTLYYTVLKGSIFL